MKDQSKTKQVLVQELALLKERIKELEQEELQRKQAKEALSKSETRFYSYFNMPLHGIAITSPEKGWIQVNDKICSITGYSRDEIVRMTWAEMTHPDDLAADVEQFSRVLSGQIDQYAMNKRFIRKDGKVIWTNIAVGCVRESDGRVDYIVGLMEDITERKQAEAALKEKVEDLRRLATVVSDSNDAVIMHDLEGKILAWNRGARETYGYTEAEALEKNVRDIVAETDREAALNLIQKIKQGEIVKSFELRRVTKDGRILDVWLTTTLLTDEKGNPVAIVTTERDITERRMSAERLRKALDATVHAIALIVETRDPYTAGHQRKVANLACAIAKEINLSTEQVESIRLVGIIHDIGKISVPVEILSKPTELTNLEFSLIKTHSQSGYDMLKGIVFPWPIARMVLEHHERIDGSGYPNGLTGDKLLIESRILSVADVVEAMASHRPYRPRLGIDAALEEISKNKGILYDAAVGDACIRLFRVKGYKIID
jgi:PAS domain S-box-containing protein